MHSNRGKAIIITASKVALQLFDTTNPKTHNVPFEKHDGTNMGNEKRNESKSTETNKQTKKKAQKESIKK